MREQPLMRLETLAPFFERVSAAGRRGLLLDFFGTIAPFADDRRRAAPYPGVRAQLEELSWWSRRERNLQLG